MAFGNPDLEFLNPTVPVAITSHSVLNLFCIFLTVASPKTIADHTYGTSINRGVTVISRRDLVVRQQEQLVAVEYADREV
ncbi:hypothetical protein J6590_081215 [Homalodisca vitripennis]|nr:hypothetical protein J6590_081215 [Homalodisca vitripennis]